MYADIVVAIIILISALVGLKKGFMKTILSFAGFFVSLIVSYFLLKPVISALKGTALDNFILNKSQQILSGFGNIMVKEIPSYEMLIETLSEKIPAFLAEALAKPLSELIGSNANMTLAEILAPNLANILMNIVVYIGLVLIISIILAIVKAIIKTIVELPIIKQIDRLLGFVLGAAMGVLVVYLILLLMSLLNGMELLKPAFDAIEQSKFTIIMYKNNLITIIFKQLLDGGTINLESLTNNLPIDINNLNIA